MTLKICLGGVSGWTGSAVAQAVLAASDMELVSCLSRKYAGQNLSQLPGFAGAPYTVPVYDTVEAALACAPTVYIDYTSAEAVKGNVKAALAQGVHCVVGSSGLSQEAYAELESLALAKGVGLIACGNFSITAALAKHFSLLAAKYLPHREIIDYSHAEKPDAPSGTARELAEALAAVAENQMLFPVSATVGEPGARGAQIKGTPVHSLRLPGYVLAFESIFSMPEERLIIKHEAGKSAAPYVDGTMLAVRRVTSIKGLVRGLDTLLFS